MKIKYDIRIQHKTCVLIAAAGLGWSENDVNTKLKLGMFNNFVFFFCENMAQPKLCIHFHKKKLQYKAINIAFNSNAANKKASELNVI
jgi:hypothetical protein